MHIKTIYISSTKQFDRLELKEVCLCVKMKIAYMDPQCHRIFATERETRGVWRIDKRKPLTRRYVNQQTPLPRERFSF